MMIESKDVSVLAWNIRRASNPTAKRHLQDLIC